MSLKDLKNKSTSALDSISSTPAKPATSARPVTAPGATAMMQPTIDALNERAKSAEARATEAEQSLAIVELKINDSPKELPLDVLVEVEGRRRKLTAEQFEELVANLTENPLVQPVVVKKLEDGKYEVVSGHNRLAAYRLLGRHSIPVTVSELEDRDRAAFFANLLQPTLPDYAKYLGFKKWQEETEDSQAVMAKKAGTTKNTISRLFAFADLPAEAVDLIAEKPEVIGASCASDLSRLVAAGKKNQVVEAIRLLAAGEITQIEAVKLAGKQEPKVRQVEENFTVKIKAGRLEYCRYSVKGGTLRIDFKDALERQNVEEKIAKLLQDLAEKARET